MSAVQVGLCFSHCEWRWLWDSEVWKLRVAKNFCHELSSPGRKYIATCRYADDCFSLCGAYCEDCVKLLLKLTYLEITWSWGEMVHGFMKQWLDFEAGMHPVHGFQLRLKIDEEKENIQFYIDVSTFHGNVQRQMRRFHDIGLCAQSDKDELKRLLVLCVQMREACNYPNSAIVKLWSRSRKFGSYALLFRSLLSKIFR